jgi:hypothetical protein
MAELKARMLLSNAFPPMPPAKARAATAVVRTGTAESREVTEGITLAARIDRDSIEVSVIVLLVLTPPRVTAEKAATDAKEIKRVLTERRVEIVGERVERTENVGMKEVREDIVVYRGKVVVASRKIVGEHIVNIVGTSVVANKSTDSPASVPAARAKKVIRRVEIVGEKVIRRVEIVGEKVIRIRPNIKPNMIDIVKEVDVILLSPSML